MQALGQLVRGASGPVASDLMELLASAKWKERCVGMCATLQQLIQLYEVSMLGLLVHRDRAVLA